MYTCRGCKNEVQEVHVCGSTPKGAPVIVQYVNRYPARRDAQFMKTFGSRSERKKQAIRQNLMDKGMLF